jgi:hypothetical protein
MASQLAVTLAAGCLMEGSESKGATHEDSDLQKVERQCWQPGYWQ